jgi:hypothetical protein
MMLPIDRERLDSGTHMHAARALAPVNLLLLLLSSLVDGRASFVQ